MCCGGKNCKGSGNGNFTYVAYATDINGTDFARTQNELGVKRCYQAIVTSSNALDENASTFSNLFYGKYFYICGSSNAEGDCGCCEKFPFPVYGDVEMNSKTFNNQTGLVLVGTEAGVENSMRFIFPANEDVWLVSSMMKDSDGNVLQNLESYYFEYYLVANTLNEGESVKISLGDGGLGIPIIITPSTLAGLNKGVIKANVGASFLASDLVVKMTIDSDEDEHAEIKLKNFRFGKENCFVENIITNVIPFGKFEIFKASGNPDQTIQENGDMVQGFWPYANGTEANGGEVVTGNYIKAKYNGGGLTLIANYTAIEVY